MGWRNASGYTDPINNPPVVDPEGPSVYRPEAGSYISNIAAANSLFSHRLHDRLGEPQYTDSLHSQGSASSMWMRHVGGTNVSGPVTAS